MADLPGARRHGVVRAIRKGQLDLTVLFHLETSAVFQFDDSLVLADARLGPVEEIDHLRLVLLVNGHSGVLFVFHHNGAVGFGEDLGAVRMLGETGAIGVVDHLHLVFSDQYVRLGVLVVLFFERRYVF
jgi:hypothetical protein